MVSEPGLPTLDQLRVFVTVVEVGSFAGAARKLKRATSVISYAVANLENQLGVSLFDRKSTRKPQLTEAGKMVLAEARTVANGINDLRAKVKGLMQGLEAEVHAVIDVMMPAERVVDALKAFRAQFPTVTLHLRIEAMGAVTQLVLDRTATVGISGPLSAGIDGLERINVGTVVMIPVAAPGHPLALAGRNRPGAGRDHIQLVLTDRSSLTKGREFAVLSTHTWRLADLGSKHMLLKENIGWGNMPLPIVEEDLKAGRLVHLSMPDAQRREYAMDAIYRTDTPPGPAAAWLIERFRQQANETPAPKKPAKPSKKTKNAATRRR